MEGFKTPIRLDRNSFGGGIAIYIRENIPSKILEQLPAGANDEGIFVELNLRNSKWVLFAGYSPSNIEIIMNKFVNDYDNIIMMGDFNCDVDNKYENYKILNFFESFSLTNIVKEPTYFKNPIKPTCIDLIITDRKESFSDTTVIETGLSDYHLMTVTCLNKYIKKLPPKITCYRSYKTFDANAF